MGDLYNTVPALNQHYLDNHRAQGHNDFPHQISDTNFNAHRNCTTCGFIHGAHVAPNQCGKGQTGEKKDGKEGNKEGQDKGRSSNGGGDRDSSKETKGGKGGDRGRGAGDADPGSASDSDSDGGKGPPPGSGKPMNVDDPYVIPVWLPDYVFYGVVAFTVISLLSLVACRGTQSMWDCLKITSLTGGLSSCDLNDGVNKFFEKTGVGAKNQSDTSGKDKATATAPAPAHLEEKMRQVKKALRNANCQKYGSDEKCTGLVDYAGTMAGGAIVSTANTVIVRSKMLCRCMDPTLYKHVCFPGEGKCSDCECDSIPIDTLITEEEKLMPGKCWAFKGAGELQIKLFYPLIVLGTTIHHPSKSRLPPGYFSSAPKDFELWGLGENKTAPHHFGTFQFKEDGGSTQVFEIQMVTFVIVHVHIT